MDADELTSWIGRAAQLARLVAMSPDVDPRLRELAYEVDGPSQQAEDAAAEHESEHRALLADNAALRKRVLALAEWTPDVPRPVGVWLEELRQEMSKVAHEPHPGAALLSEMEALKRERDEARAALAAKTAVALQYETDLRRAESTARADALAEAYAAVRNNESRNHPLFHALEAIRALATTPPPPVVPVAKVREVLQRIGRDVYTAPVPYVIQKAAESLGISLDGET